MNGPLVTQRPPMYLPGLSGLLRCVTIFPEFRFHSWDTMTVAAAGNEMLDKTMYRRHANFWDLSRSGPRRRSLNFEF